MRIGIGTKYFLAFVLATLMLLALTALAVQWSFKRGLVDYVGELRDARLLEVAERLGEAYAEEQSWAFLRDNPRRLRRLVGRGGRGRAPSERPREFHRERPRGLDPNEMIGALHGIAIVDDKGSVVVGPPTPAGKRFDIEVDGTVVGGLIVPPMRVLSDRTDVEFAARQGRFILLIFFAGLILAAALAWLLSRQLRRPIRELARGTQELAAGRYGTAIDVNQRDELGQLAGDFNALSMTLAQNRQQRRDLMADLSHELRTPLTALRGQVAALRDGVRPVNDDTLMALDGQVSRLVTLVDEIYDLALADSGSLTYTKEPLDLKELVRECAASFASRFAERGIALEQDWPDEALAVFGDRQRLDQLFANLLENTARYTDAGGRAVLSGHRDNDRVRICLDDSAPGVSQEALPRLFDRLFRVEKSRSRESGGAGLGLALAKKIAAAHGGRIHAAASDLGGVRVVVDLGARSDDER